MPIRWAAASHPGRRRATNEDCHAERPDLGLYVVADGMGGHVAGEVASRVAVDSIESFVAETVGVGENDTWPFPFQPELSLAANRLKGGFLTANRRIASLMADEADLRGMATTASAVLVAGPVAVVAHVGDSRVYLLRDAALDQLTLDHSWVEEQVRAGTMSATMAREHPWRNVVTRALSGGEDPEVDVRELTLSAGDRLLLCSDGLFTVVSDEAIGGIVASRRALPEICDALVEAANRAGGPDNITVLVLELDAA
jgi:protein phosphatase